MLVNMTLPLQCSTTHMHMYTTFQDAIFSAFISYTCVWPPPPPPPTLTLQIGWHEITPCYDGSPHPLSLLLKQKGHLCKCGVRIGGIEASVPPVIMIQSQAGPGPRFNIMIQSQTWPGPRFNIMIQSQTWPGPRFNIMIQSQTWPGPRFNIMIQSQTWPGPRFWYNDTVPNMTWA